MILPRLYDSKYSHLVDIGSQEEVSHAYASLLGRVCSSFALFHPRSAADGGGTIGDCGYIEKGSFRKLFNVYENPPVGLPRLDMNPREDIEIDERVNHTPFQSSRTSEISFEAAVKVEVSAPLLISPTSVNPKVSLKQSSFAFLALVGRVYYVKTLKRPRHTELEDYATKYRHNLRNLYHTRVAFVCETTQASGYVGGVAYRHRKDIVAEVGFRMMGFVTAAPEVAVTQEDHTISSTCGPSTWHEGISPEQTVALSFVIARRRTKQALGQLRDTFHKVMAPGHNEEPNGQLTNGMIISNILTQEPQSTRNHAEKFEYVKATSATLGHSARETEEDLTGSAMSDCGEEYAADDSDSE